MQDQSLDLGVPVEAYGQDQYQLDGLCEPEVALSACEPSALITLFVPLELQIPAMVAGNRTASGHGPDLMTESCSLVLLSLIG